MTTLPTGETLPAYDDDPGPVSPAVLLAVLAEKFPQRWAIQPCPCGAHGCGDDGVEENQMAIRDVLTALAIAGDATLVKNATYRAMRRDGAAVERLNAWLINHGAAGAVLEADGDAVEAAVTILGPMLEAARALRENLTRLADEHRALNAVPPAAGPVVF